MSRPLFLLVGGALVFTLCASAAERRPGEVLTLNRRIDPATGTAAPLASIAPTALVVDGDSYLALASGTGSSGMVRKVWRHEPATGRQTLLAVTTTPANFIHGINVLAKGPSNRVYLLSGSSVTAFQGWLEIRLDTGEQRLLTNTAVTLRDLAVAENGHLIGITTAGAVQWRNADGELLVATGGAGLHALTQTPDGRWVGIAPNGLVAPNHQANLMEIDPDTGALSPLATLPGMGIRNATLRLAATSDGGFVVSSHLSSSNFQLYRVLPGSFDVQEIPLADGVRIPAISDLDIDPSDDILLTAHDTRLSAAGLFVTYRIHPETGDTSLALGNRLSPTSADHMALGSDWALYFTGSGNANRDRVYRQDLTTGGVTLVTSKESEGAVLTSAAQIAVSGDDVFVINQTDNNQNSHLIHVDARTGSQTHLTLVGNRLFLRHMVFDETTGDLFLSAWGGHTEGCCGSIIRLRPEPGAVPEIISTTGYLGNPEGLRVAPDGSLWVVGRTEQARGIYRVDRQTGEQSVITEDPLLVGPLYLAFLDDGDLLIGDLGDTTTRETRILRRDGATGELTVLLDSLGGDPALDTNLSGIVDLLVVPGNATPAPALMFGIQPDQRLRLTWSPDDGPWHLEATDALESDTWSLIEADPSELGDGSWGIDVPLSADQEIYRLRSLQTPTAR